jgi:DNA-directed RNA polymerase subunit RPC12/RpoP
VSHIYRCSKCRTRNTFRRALASYVRGKRCRHCGHAGFYVDRERMNRIGCQCGGYHFPHRPGSPCCDHHPARDYWRALREGATGDDLLDASLRATGKVVRGNWCPF